MTRDPDLIRGILLMLEEHPAPTMPQKEFHASYEDRRLEFSGHVSLLRDAGFVEPVPYGTNPFHAWRLTWNGHEFLENTRNPEIWDQTKSGAAKLGTFSITVLSELAIGFVKAKAASLGLPMV